MTASGRRKSTRRSSGCARDGERAIEPCIPNQSAVGLHVEPSVSCIAHDRIRLDAQTGEIRMRTRHPQETARIFPHGDDNRPRSKERQIECFARANALYRVVRDPLPCGIGILRRVIRRGRGINKLYQLFCAGSLCCRHNALLSLCYKQKKTRPSAGLCTPKINGRDDRVRTCGLIVPNDARYQTAPHPDNDSYFSNF